MKRILSVLMALLLFIGVGVLHGQAGPSSFSWSSVSATGNTTTVSFINGPLPSNFTIAYAVSGTVSACTFQTQGSLDNVNWFSVGPSTTCTATSAISMSSTPVDYLRISVSAFTGSGHVIFSEASATPVLQATNVTTPYLGLVGTRAEQAELQTATKTWAMIRTFSIAKVAIPAGGQKILWGNYYVNAGAPVGTETNPGSATYQASIEYPAGVIYPCTFGGQTTATVAGLADALTDWCGPSIPVGAMYWTRLLYVNASGVLYNNPPIAGHYSTTLDAYVTGTGTPTNDVNSGTVSGGGGTLMYSPYAIIGYTNKPSVCIVGDSRVWGLGDSISDATGDVGEVARAVGAQFAYTKLATPGVTAQETVSSFTNRSRIAQYCSHMIDQLGINDVTNSESASTIAGYRTTLAGKFPNAIVIGTTVPPADSSTDSYATTTNQTVTSNPAAFNALVRAGISGEANYFDLDYIVDPTGINKWCVSQNVFATTGTAGFCTTDGLHESQAENIIEAHSLYVNMQLIKLP